MYQKKIPSSFFHCCYIVVLIISISCNSTSTKQVAEDKMLLALDTFPINFNKDVIFDMDGEIREEGRLVMTYVSPLVFSRTETDSSLIEFEGGIKGNFYNSKTNKKSGYMKANYAIYYREQNRMYLKGKVKIINNQKDILKADDLWWDQAKDEIYTDGRVSFLQGSSKLYGIGFRSTEDMNEYEVKKLTGKINDNSF